MQQGDFEQCFLKRNDALAPGLLADSIPMYGYIYIYNNI